MAAATATILLPGGQVTVTGEADADALWLTPAELGKAGGWEFKPDGLGRAYSEPIAESLADFRARAEKAGRDPAGVTVSIFGVPPDADKLGDLRDAGVARVVFFVPSAIADTVLPLLDGYAAVAKKVG